MFIIAKAPLLWLPILSWAVFVVVVALRKYCDNLGEKEFLLIHCSGLESSTVGESQQQELETAGQVTSRVESS